MTGKKYYKVVDRVCGHYISVMVGGSDIGVNYPIGAFAYPKVENSKLFVFDDLQAAIDFSIGLLDIFECEVINPVKYTGYIAKWYMTNDIMRFWKTGIAAENARPVISDTVLCDAVKLIREIKIED